MTTHVPRHMYGTLLGGYKEVMIQEFAAMSSNHSRDTQQRTYVNPMLHTLQRVSADLLYSSTTLGASGSVSTIGQRKVVMGKRAEKRLQEGIAATNEKRKEAYFKVRTMYSLFYDLFYSLFHSLFYSLFYTLFYSIFFSLFYGLFYSLF